jgi:methionyl-tRNA synthetase
LRYYLLRHIHPVDDSDMTMEKFQEAYTAHLVNGLGNLVSRLMNMSEKYCRQPHLNADTLQEHQSVSDSALWKDVANHVDEFNFLHAMDLLWHKVNLMDLEITEKEPFKIYKQNPEQAQAIIRSLVLDLAKLSGVLKAFLPETANKINEAILANQKPTEPLFPRIELETNDN